MPQDGAVRAAILCGGEGKRLRPLTEYFQKTMIPIGPAMRPLLEFIVKLMVHHGIPDVVLLTGYKAEEIERYFGDGSQLGARISYSKDPPGARGSAQALIHAIDEGKAGRFEELVVYYGDVLSALDVGAVVERHRSARADITLVLSKNYSVPVGVAEVSGEHVRAFREKPNLGIDVTMGCLVVAKSCVPVLEEVTRGGQSNDIMTHLVPSVIERGMKVVPYYLEGFWHDLGTPEAYGKLDSRAVETNLGFLDAVPVARSAMRTER